MKKIGLACTGGGVKSASNIGVIKAMQELGIEISAISGTSIGSCAAILYAMGYTTEEMIDKFKIYSVEFPRFNFLNKIVAPFNFVFRGGAKNTKIIEEIVKKTAMEKGKKYMSDIEMPIFIPTMDITYKETVYYSSKEIEEEKCYTNRPIYEAIRNTCSLPMLYIPNNVYIDGELHQFSDGGMNNNSPTIHMNEFADIVIGVENIYNKQIEKKKVNIISGIRSTFQSMRRASVYNQKKAADIWIEVDCKDVGIIGREKEIEMCVKQGYNAAKKILSEYKMQILN